ncbi:MAG: hypothetical protein ISQ08_03680 [Planctomycetes bacterium]|nr:hypothetical protein [Planctomycetota bacterium]
MAGPAPLHPADGLPEGSFVELGGEPHYRIARVDGLPPFLISLVSASDHWMFASSSGGLTAGRRDAAGALFPYTTDDRVHDSSGRRGPRTVLRVRRGEVTSLWEPLLPGQLPLDPIERSLSKNVAGTRLVFEERNLALGLTFRATWTSGERFGFQRRVELLEERGEPVHVEVLDGLLDLLPASVDTGMQANYSTLVDAYKRTELCGDTGLALYRLSSIPVDRPEPSEALAVNTVWCHGLDEARILLSERQLEAFRRGGAVEPEQDVRGVRGAYLVRTDLALGAGESRSWTLVAEVEQDSAAVAHLQRDLRARAISAAELDQDARDNAWQLTRLVARADGLQRTGSALEDARHFANTLFNIMRGGVFEERGEVPGRDLEAFVAEVAPRLADRHAALLASLPERGSRAAALEALRAARDPDLERVASEYLPLRFSRRHGDPSRPWNAFAISRPRTRVGSPYAYQGNWRDIFQNWEALCASFPAYLEATVTRFVNASTADGYNPYRVTRAGFEWEVPDPEDPWAFIGYWNDHQLVYLVRLLQLWRKHDPEALAQALSREGFVYADVPYRIAGFDSICANPKDTITYDNDHAAQVARRVASEGHEGRFVRNRAGRLHRVPLAEKLLVPVLVKLSNLVPEVGLWLTTQRPEWNDANNALVGIGASVVTLAHLSQALALYEEAFEAAGGKLTLSEEVHTLWREVSQALAGAPPEGLLDGTARRSLLERLGRAGERHRTGLYAQGFSGARIQVSATEVAASLRRARAWVDHSVRANRRADGLFHSYNLLSFAEDGAVEVRHLPVMLEGQVAVLAAGLLEPAEERSLLASLRASDLFREDQHSYLLYPDRRLPGFLEINRIPAARAAASPLLQALAASGDRSLVVPGLDGELHFAAPHRNAAQVAAALDRLARGPHADLARTDRAAILELYEELFDHSAFTGRSGTFYGYEGLGCIYWHQVSKLLLAVRERCDEAPDEELERVYDDVRLGLGTHKSPAVYGAFPTDPYSHTPSFAGAQQPGMTGQVKEDWLARMAELGVAVRAGCLHLGPTRAAAVQFLDESATFEWVDERSELRTLELSPGSLAFTYCQVPVVLHQGGAPRIVLHGAAGLAPTEVEGHSLDSATSAALFARSSGLERIEVFGR